MLRLKDIWKDPVGSKVIAAIIVGGAASIAGFRFRAFLWDEISVPLLLLLIFVIVAATGYFLFAWAYFKLPRELKPQITLVDVAANLPANRGATYPVKCYVTMRNDSRISVDVRLHQFKPSVVTLKAFAFDVLQIKVRDWVPAGYQADRIAVYPGQLFRAWLGVDDSKFDESKVNSLRGKIGTLTFMVDELPMSYDL
jgi:hypothetical protein